MKPTERPAPPHSCAPGLETTAGDSSSGRTSAADQGEFTADEPTELATSGGVGGDSDATSTPTPAGPNPDATAAFDRDANPEHDPTATLGPDGNATGNFDPDATDGLVHSSGVAAADTERDSRSAKAHGYADVVGLETDPDLEPIREEPAFRALLAEFPLPATTIPEPPQARNESLGHDALPAGGDFEDRGAGQRQARPGGHAAGDCDLSSVRERLRFG
jgi:hypothetical protein